MLKNIFIIFCVVYLSACASTTAPQKVAADNSRTIELADKAFEELDSGNTEVVDNVTLPNEELEVEEPQEIEEKAKPSSLSVEDKKRPDVIGKTKYPIVNGYPIWVITPEKVTGYKYVAVGNAAKNNQGTIAQKRIATTVARAELSRMVSVQVDNEIKSERTIHTINGNEQMLTQLDTYSRQRSSMIMQNVEEVDIWVKDDTGELYILLGLK